MSKQFKIPADRLRPLAQGRGSCIASDHIIVEGRPVGYIYREQTESVLDSGWRFFSGAESQDYADNPDNFALYDVNTIANYDLTIIPYLDQPVDTA
jgi:hypothetical protein